MRFNQPGKDRTALRDLRIPIGRRRQRSLLALVIFISVATMLLHRALLPDYTLLPLNLIQTIAPWDHLELGPLANPLISDPFYSFYTRRHFLTTEIQSGQFPLWNPYILTGTPTIANPNFQPFYLPNLIAALLLPTHHALPWLAWGHLIVTGWLMYGFLRRQKLQWLACVLGGSAWMLNGYLVVWLENPHRLSTLTWLPGIFWAYQSAVAERRLDYAAVGGLLLGLSILGGQMQFVFASGLILGLYALGNLVWDGYKRSRWSLRPLLPLFTIGLIGLGIGAITLLPAGEFASFSQRVRFSPETVIRTRWPWQHIVTLIAPDFYGNPVNPEGHWSPFNNYAELAAYFGVISLLLALTAPVVARRRKFLFTTLIITTFVLAIIFGTPLVRILFLFPGSQFVVLNRLLFLLPLWGAWLAALGLDGWITTPTKRRWSLPVILFLIGSITAVTLWNQQVTAASHPVTYRDLAHSGFLLLLGAGLVLLLARRPRLAGGALVLLALVDLWQWGWDFNPITPTAYLYPENEVANYLQQDPSHFRVLPLQSGKLVFGPNVLSIFDIETIGGYTPLIRADYYNFYKAISDRVDFAWLRSSPNKLAMSEFEPAVSLLNVKYVLSANPLPADARLQVEQMECDTAVFLDDNWTTQSFTATEPGLNRIDLLLAPRASTGDATLAFRLWRDEIGGELVAETEIPASQIDTPSPHTIYFAPVADAAGQPFVWGVSGDETTAVCATGPEQALSFAAYGTQLISHGKKDDVWIYENPNTLPRAYLVHHAETVTVDHLLNSLHDPDFNYYHTALLTIPLPEEQAEQLAARPVRPQGDVEITNYDLHQINLSVTTSQPGILVLADAYYPDWQARVNGTKQEILPVNDVLRGVFVPAGRHTITFQFRPLALYWGLGLAGLSILTALIIFIGSRVYQNSVPDDPLSSEQTMRI